MSRAAAQPSDEVATNGPTVTDVTQPTPTLHTVNDLALRSFSTRRANAPIYVLLHGIGMSHRYHARLHAQLATDAEVHSIDLPGFAGLPKPGRNPGIRDVSEALGLVLDLLDVRAAVVVGHSMGAQWAVELGVRRPDLVGGVVAFGPVTDRARRGPLTQAALLARDSALEPPRLNGIVVTDYARCGPAWYVRQARHMLSYPIEDRVAMLTVPLLVVRGGTDPIARQAWAELLAARAVDGEVAVIPGHRHLAHFTAPAASAERIRAFAAAKVRPPLP